MKKIFIVVIGLLFCVGSFGQKNFEGEIKYEIIVKALDYRVGEMEVFFKDKKILIINHTGENNLYINKVLYNFETGLKYSIDMSEKSVSVDSILNDVIYSKIDTNKKEIINFLGHECLVTKYDSLIIEENNIFDKNAFCYEASDLFFSLESKFSHSEINLLLSTNHKIFLLTSFSNLVYKKGESEVVYKAKKVINEILSDTIFDVPKDYEIITRKNYIGVKDAKISEVVLKEIKKDYPPPPPKNPTKTKTQKKSPNTKKKL